MTHRRTAYLATGADGVWFAPLFVGQNGRFGVGPGNVPVFVETNGKHCKIRVGYFGLGTCFDNGYDLRFRTIRRR
jgi:hypothetical protein